jgi:phosphoribosylaminoimidazole-succinocarboxamide synthase
MTIEDRALIKTNDLPIRHVGDVHDGKVRSVYWLTETDNKELSLIYEIPPSELGVMVISDRISAFECLWQSEGGLKGVPGKGAALNAISAYWFEQFAEAELTDHHVLDNPHPLVWIVRKAKPIMIEAIARQYITGSMWRDYAEQGSRDFCGIALPDGLKKDQKLDELLVTPSTKGILRGIPGVPEKDDVNVSRQQILDNYKAFGFSSPEDVELYEHLLKKGFEIIDRRLAELGKIFVDTKFEFGYAPDREGALHMIYMDEIGTPDSSRYWTKALYAQGKTVEESKELLRQILLEGVPDRDVLLNKKRMAERQELARTYRLKDEDMMAVSALYTGLAEQITGRPIKQSTDARQEIIDTLSNYGLIEKGE